MRTRKSIFNQLAVTITLLIFSIEGVLLVLSVKNRKNQYIKIKKQIIKDLKIESSDKYPLTVLSEEDIERRANKFRNNIIWLTILISVVVTSGTLWVFHFIAGRHIRMLAKINDSENIKHAKDILRWPDIEDIPNNEIGEIVKTREKMIDELVVLQNNLEEELNITKQHLIQAAKLTAIGELTTSIIHDLKNPLSLINLVKEMMSKDDYKGLNNREVFTKHLKNLDMSVDRLNSLIRRMGDFSRSQICIENGVNLKSAIDNSKSFLKSKMVASNIDCIDNISDNNLTCYGDITSIEQVLSNIISNAVDAMKESKIKKIFFDTGFDDRYVWVKVRDTGTGIASEKLESIFTAFYTTKTKGQGTGLGLSSVQAIMKQLEGEVSVESELGQGTIFTLKFLREKSDS